jgi:prepilin-type N-terminal cleavage/methylation domain-containing protein
MTLRSETTFTRKRTGGFTLIELLIVVLIIAILAAIAIPNFLEFQVRAKVSRSLSDMRTIATALEAYAVDEGAYPFIGMKTDYTEKLSPLTTPIAYLGSIPGQAFKEWTPFGGTATRVYYYQNKEECDVLFAQFPDWGHSWPYYIPNGLGDYQWYLSSVGPDGEYDQPWSGEPGCNYLLYDPTNGSVSEGDIIRIGP